MLFYTLTDEFDVFAGATFPTRTTDNRRQFLRPLNDSGTKTDKLIAVSNELLLTDDVMWQNASKSYLTVMKASLAATDKKGLVLIPDCSNDAESEKRHVALWVPSNYLTITKWEGVEVLSTPGHLMRGLLRLGTGQSAELEHPETKKVPGLFGEWKVKAQVKLTVGFDGKHITIDGKARKEELICA